MLGDIPSKYPLYKVYMGLIIKGPPSQGVFPPIFPMKELICFQVPSTS